MKNNCNKNISFYYYGQDHLILNMYKYLKCQMEENNYVFLHCDKSIANIINKTVNDTEKNMMGYLDFDKIILSYLSSTNSTPEDKLELKEAVTLLEQNGFLGGVIVLDASYLIDSIGQENFKKYLKSLSHTCQNNNFSILTCYDFSDYINRGKIINDEIIKLSYFYHDYRLYSNKILPVDSFDIYSNLA